MNLFRKKDLIGLDIGTNSLKLAQLKKNAKGYELVKAALKPLPPGVICEDEILDRKTVIEAIRQLVQEQRIAIKNVATSVSGRSVIIKRIKLPTMPEEELRESILYEAEQYIPFDINDVNLDFQIMQNARQEEEGAMDVLLVAVKKERIQEVGSIITEAGLTPSVIDVDVFALENQYEVNYEQETGNYVVLLDIGADTMNMNILWEGGTVFTRDASLGGNNYSKSLQKSLDLDFAKAEKLKQGDTIEGILEDQIISIRANFYEEIFSEIQRSFDYFRATADNTPITKILLSGGTSKAENLDQALAQRFELEVEKVDPFQKIQINPNQFDTEWLAGIAPMMAVVVGLAVRRMDDR